MFGCVYILLVKEHITVSFEDLFTFWMNVPLMKQLKGAGWFSWSWNRGLLCPPAMDVFVDLKLSWCQAGLLSPPLRNTRSYPAVHP